jgi:3-hydroxyacyl-[acyl-carrier-protein] dehydratase
LKSLRRYFRQGAKNGRNRKKDARNSADIMKIMKLLPHRYPFLLIDRIIEMDGDNSCIGIKNVTINEPQFQGTLSGTADVSRRSVDRGHGANGRCIVRSCARCNDAPPQFVYFMTIDRAKFRKPVEPGDQVHFHVKKIKQRANIWKFDAVAMVDGTQKSPKRRSARCW